MVCTDHSNTNRTSRGYAHARDRYKIRVLVAVFAAAALFSTISLRGDMAVRFQEAEDDVQHSLRVGDTVLLYAKETNGYVFSELSRYLQKKNNNNVMKWYLFFVAHLQ